MFKLGNKSYSNLIGVNPILSSIVVHAISKSKYDFTVFEGIRTHKRQKYLVDTGRSWTMRSNHLTGNAVDLVPWIDNGPRWDGYNTTEVFNEIHRCMMESAKEAGVELTWGGDWKTSDKPHYELKPAYRGNYDYRRIIKA